MRLLRAASGGSGGSLPRDGERSVNGLDRRVTVLEKAAQVVHRRELREYVVTNKHGPLSEDQIEEIVDLLVDDEYKIAEWRRVGLTEPQIEYRYAEHIGRDFGLTA